MANERIVDFTIKATDLSTQPLKEVVAQVKILTTTLNEQVQASLKGAANAGQFAKSLADVGKAADALIKQKLSLQDFELKDEKIRPAVTAFENAQEARDAFVKGLPAAQEMTTKQVSQLHSFETAVNRAGAALLRTMEAYGTSLARMDAMGVGAHELAEANALLASAFVTVGEAARAGVAADRNYIANQREAIRLTRERAEALAAVAKADAAVVMESKAAAQAERDRLTNVDKSIQNNNEPARRARQYGLEDTFAAALAEEKRLAQAERDAAEARKKFATEQARLDGEFARQRRAEREAEIAALVEIEQMRTRLNRPQQEARHVGLTETFRAAAEQQAEDDAALARGTAKVAANDAEANRIRIANTEARFDAERRGQEELYRGLFKEIELRDKAAEAAAKELEVLEKLRAVSREAAAAVAAMQEPNPATLTATQSLQDRVRAQLARGQANTSPFGSVETPDGAFGEVLRLKGVIESGEKALAGYKKELGELSVAEKEVARQAGIIDSFRAKERAVAEATKAFHDAKEEVKRLNAEALLAGSSSEASEIVTKIGPASRQVSTAASRLAAEKEAYAQEVQALRAIGVEVHEIENASRRLEQTSILASKARMTQNENERISLANLAVQAQTNARAIEAQVAAQRASAGNVAAPSGTSAVREGLAGLGSASSQDGALRGRSVDEGLDDLERVAKRGVAIGSVYSRQLELMHAVQTRIATDTGLIEAFERQTQAVQHAEAAYRADDDALKKLIADMATGVGSLRELAEAEAKVAASGANLQRGLAAHQATGAELKKQGIDTNNLAGATENLVGKVARLGAASKGIEKGSKLFGLEPYQLKNLEYQLGDVYTQLSLGQGLMRTFESQADQIFQIFDFSIVQFKRMLIYGAPAIAIIYVFVSALMSVKAQVDELRKINAQLMASVDGANTTAAAMLSAEKSVQRLGASFADASKAIEIFYRAGINPDRLKDFGRLAQDLVEVYGEKLPEAAKKITEGFTHGYEGIKKLDEEYNFLSAAERDRIRTLIEQGRLQDALTLAFDRFKTQQDGAAAASRTTWTEAVITLKNAWNDLLVAFGRSSVISNLIASMTQLLGAMRAVVQFADGEISARNFATRLNNALSGRDQKSEADEKVRDLRAKRDELQGFLPGLERSQALNPNPQMQERITQMKTQIEELNVQIKAVGAGAYLERIETQLEAVKKQREELHRRQGIITSKEEPSALAATTSNPGVPASYTAMRDQIADKVGLDREALARVQRQEGVYANGQWKTSRTGVEGPMQVTQATFDELRTRYPNIGPDRTDAEASTLAGAYYLRENLQKTGGNLPQAYGKYNGVPGETLAGNAAKHEGVSINGYTGQALTRPSESLAAYDLRIKALEVERDAARGNVAATPGAPALAKPPSETVTQPAGPTSARDTEQAIKRKNDLNDAEKEADGLARRDRNLRGEAAIAQDHERLEEFEKRLRVRYGQGNVDLSAERKKVDPENKYKNDDAGLLTANDKDTENGEIRVLRSVQRERERLANIRQKNEEADRAKDLAAETALINELAAAKAHIDNKDKTNIDARRRAVDEAFVKYDKLMLQARERGLTTIQGVPIDEFAKRIEAAKNEEKDQVTVQANELILNDIVKERASIYKKINEDLKSGAISITEAFAQAAIVEAKFKPKLEAARATANADLTRQGGANPSQAIQTALAANNAIPLSDTKESRELLDNGFLRLAEYQKARKEIAATQKELVADGLETTAQGEAKIKKAYDDTEEAVRTRIKALRELLELQRAAGTIDPADYAKKDADLIKADADAKYVSPFDKKLSKTIDESMVNNAVRGFDTIAAAAGKVVVGQAKIGDLFKSMGQASADFAAGVLKDIAQMIIKFEVLALVESLVGKSGAGGGSTGGAGSSGGGPSTGSIFASMFKMAAGYVSGGLTNLFDGVAGAAVGSPNGLGGYFGGTGGGASGQGGTKDGQADLNESSHYADAPTDLPASHNGSIVGSSTQTRRMDPAVFDFARRYHAGGMVGLSHDEVPTILQRGEEVMTRSDARHTLNGGKNGKSETVTPRVTRNVLVLDPKDLSGALAGSHGEDVVLMHIRNNPSLVKSSIGA